MPSLNRASNEKELEYLIRLFLRAETSIINEIGRLPNRRCPSRVMEAAAYRFGTALAKRDKYRYNKRIKR